jgi:RHS repeat-associated protein
MSKALIKIFLLFLLFILRLNAFAGIEPYKNFLKGSIKVGDSILVKDEKFKNSSFNWSEITNISVQNSVILQVINEQPIAQSFSCSVKFRLEYFSSPEQVIPTKIDSTSLSVDYNKEVGATYKGKDIFSFQNGYYVKLYVIGISSPEFGTNPPPNLQLTSLINIDRTYLFKPHIFLGLNGEVGAGGKTKGKSAQRISGGNLNNYGNQLSLTWGNDGNGEEFDLEWMTVDSGSDWMPIISAPSTYSNEQLGEAFRNNATRITTVKHEYVISLIYDAAYIMVRIRPVHYLPDGTREEGDWYYQQEDQAYAIWPLQNGHQPGLNWQYSAAFAEEGKKKEVVTYLDGSLRGRQTVTLSNSESPTDDVAIVQENVYDEFGRPAASILPAPEKQDTVTNYLHYFPAFNRNTAGAAYSYADLSTTTCEVVASPLNNDFGASRYYSIKNPFKTPPLHKSYIDYIPDAAGKPLSITRYTPDNTGRIREQGGVGEAFQTVALGHTTKYFYSKPDQWELDRIFGNDVGYAEHYLKNMVVDPNGQASISYVNASGKTIATALTGPKPDNVDSLSGKPLVKRDTITLFKPENFLFSSTARSLKATTSKSISVPGPVKLFYDIEKLISWYPGGDFKTCSNCYYDLKISVKDECNDPLSSYEKIVKIGDSTRNTTGAGLYSGTPIDLEFKRIGEYYITFEFAMNNAVIKRFTDDYIRLGQDSLKIKKRFEYVLNQLDSTDFKDCFSDCKTARETLGTKAAFTAMFKQKLSSLGDSLLLSHYDGYISTLYESLLPKISSLEAGCVITPVSPCDSYRQLMLQDVSPGGQYAPIDANGNLLEPSINVFNLHFRSVFPVLPESHSLYQNSLVTREDGSITSPYADGFSPAELVKYWRSEWAALFLIHHPEYCKLQFCETNSVSGNWDEKLRATSTATAQAGISGQAFIRDNPLWLLAGDPFFKPDGAGAQYRPNMLADLNNYSSNVLKNTTQTVKNISQMAVYLLYCATDNATTNTNNINNEWNTCIPKEDCRIDDREWQMYRDMYLDVKNIYFEMVRNAVCGRDCVAPTIISANPPAQCPVINLNYTGIALSSNQFREFNYQFNQQVTYNIIPGNSSTPPLISSYCSAMSSVPEFYPCLTINVPGESTPRRFVNVWKIECRESISSGCQGLTSELNIDYQSSGNVYHVNNGGYTDTYTIYEGYGSGNTPVASCPNGSSAFMFYADCLNVHFRDGLTASYTDVWVATCYGNGGGNPGGGGQPCDDGPVIFRSLEANLVRPCEEFPTASRNSRTTSLSKSTAVPAKVSYVSDINTQNIYRISDIESVTESNPKLPAERFGEAVYKEYFSVEHSKKLVNTYHNVWVAEFIPDSNSVNGKRNKAFAQMLAARSSQPAKMASRSASVSVMSTNSVPCAVVINGEGENIPSLCDPNLSRSKHTTYVFLTDGGSSYMLATNEVRVTVRYNYNSAVDEGGVTMQVYDTVIIPAGSYSGEISYYDGFSRMDQGTWGCIREERSYDCIYSITGAQLCNQQLCGGGNNPENCPPAFAGKVSRFISSSSDLNVSPGSYDNLDLQNLAEFASQLDTICAGHADEAVRRLGLIGNPAYTQAQIDLLKLKLTELCTKGGDVKHPMGASTLPDGVTVQVNNAVCRSFEEVIKAALGPSLQFTNELNPWLIDAPYPYAPLPQQTEKTISNTTSEICAKLANISTGNWQDAESLYTELKNKYGRAMQLSVEGLRILIKGCSTCKFLLKEDIILPVFLDPGSKGCITHTEYTDALQSLKQRFSQSFTPANFSNYEQILTNYMNYSFGFSLSYSKYEAFTSGQLCNEPSFTDVGEDPYACVKSKIEVAFGIGEQRYDEYISLLRNDFVNAYVANCSVAKASVRFANSEDIYHYTLYYYDQAGNLVRTIPPEGVTLLSKNEREIVAKARDRKEADYCAYLGPIDNSVVSDAFQQLSNTIGTPGNSALEFWMYSQNSGNRQFMATTPDMKYMVQTCLNDNRVNVDIYSIVQNSGTSVSIILSNHVTVDISSIKPLAAWTHLVVQGNNLASGALAIWVNGRSFTPVVGAPSAGCGWSMSGPSDMPKNLSVIKHLRTYTGRLLSPEEIKYNAESGCFAAQNTATMAWFRFNTPAIGGPTTIADHGKEETPYGGYYPEHRLATTYVYNSTNQVVKQVSPDGGTSRFWYDELSRLIVSQNAKQLAENGYSYTRYDSLNRVTQVGLKTVTASLAESGGYLLKGDYTAFLNSGSNSEITETVYDTAPGGGSGVEQLTLDNPRARVTASIYRETSGSSNINATYYSYDMAGNVKTLYQQVYGLGGSKRIDYEYDLVSGKVNFLAYQKNNKDKFFYQYKYDAENRLLSTWTGTDASLKSYGFGSQLLDPYKNMDASYEYYLHGPLARLELGREGEKVQGIDYAYTLQGWLKGVNGSTLDPNNDIGKDAITGLHQTIGKDALAFSLGYYYGDYTPIGGGGAFSAYQSNTGDDSGKALFNGNITNSTYDLAKINGGAVGYTYAYDQLNRIKLLRQRGSIGTNGWDFGVASDKFKETFTYDGNGNILSLMRNNENGGEMDKLAYNYNKEAGRLTNNRLMGVNDSGTANTSYDVGSNSYGYDAIGNLISDQTDSISKIKWNVYGKIKQIEKGVGNVYAAYAYDASGNRVSKSIGTKTDWYIRDAQGNTLAEYSTPEANESAGIWWREQQLYGSSRLGMWRPKINLASAVLTTGNQQWNTYGKKFFELSNHLGNTMVVINDVRINNSTPFEPTIINANDYYAFGGQMPGRSFALDNIAYRYGFNGKENDNEVKGTGNQQDYGMRIYDPRIGKFLSVDPITKQYPELTPYQFASNTPVWAIDMDGLEGMAATGINGQGMVINKDDAKKINAEIEKWVSNKHQQGMRNVAIANYARNEAIKQGRKDGDGIDWKTKALVYISPYWNTLAPLSDANDGAVLMKGKNLDGSKASSADYVAAGVAILLPAISGGAIKKALSGPIHHIFSNKNFIRGEKWSEKFVPLFEKAGYDLNNALNKVEVIGHYGPHPEPYHEAVYKRMIEATEGLSGAEYKKAFDKTVIQLGTEAKTSGTELNKLLTTPRPK